MAVNKNLSFKTKSYRATELNPADYNPREIGEAAFEGLKNSIERFGLVDPLILNVRTGNLVGGHQRLRAAIELGIEMVPVVEVDLSLAEEKALNVTLNNTNISGFYTDALPDLLAEIRDDLGEDLFEDLRLDDLDLDEVLPVEDEMPSEPKQKEKEYDAKATIKVRCPEDLKDEVLIFLKARLLETSFEGVEVS